jgi:hypothetical protein
LVILSFGLTWLFEIPMVVDPRGELPFSFAFWGIILMGWMPAVAAIIVAAVTGGKPAVRKLFARVLVWRVSWLWYPLAGFGTAAMWLSAVAASQLLGGSGLQIPQVSPPLLSSLLIEFVLLFLISSEELVWCTARPLCSACGRSCRSTGC